MIKLISTVVAVLTSVSLTAQTPPPTTGFEVQVYRAVDNTAGTPFRLYQATAVCGLVPTPPGTLQVNPPWLEFDDITTSCPGTACKACRIATGKFLAALPVATGYRATITALDPPSGSSSERSNVIGPFRRGPLGTLCPDKGGLQIDSEIVVDQYTRVWVSTCLVPVQ